MTTVNEVIPAALAGERLDRVVALITGLSRSEAADLVAGGAVSIADEVITSKAHRLALDDDVTVSWAAPEEAPPLRADDTVDLVVVYEDDDVIVIDKPPGLVVHPGSGNESATLVHGLLARYPEIAGVGAPDRPGIVHRLDKDTSGLMMAARSPLGYERLVGQLSDRAVHRSYVALAWGEFDVATGMVDAPIGRSCRDPTRMSVTQRGKPAVTRYAVQQLFQHPVTVSLVECRLETGRTHQIRVHLRAIGHAVVGDSRYHGVRESLPTPRLFLHAAELGFEHPSTGAPMHFDSPLPADLAEVLTRLS